VSSEQKSPGSSTSSTHPVDKPPAPVDPRRNKPVTRADIPTNNPRLVDNERDLESPQAVDNESEPVDSGADAVRAALGRAKAAAAARGDKPGQLNRTSSLAKRAWERREGANTRSGARPDARDPQAVGNAISRLVTDHGWSETIAVGGVLGRWDAVVGADVAAHCQPLTFADGVLTVAADSSAWATQVRLLMPTLLRLLAEEVGEGMVQRIVVRGPSAPSWRHGPRVAPGSQGPRDTYG
jgi:predicted nucleic acid-binding Zn ribbon protein